MSCHGGHQVITGLDVPEAFHRNAPDVATAGYELPGQALIDLALPQVGRPEGFEDDMVQIS